MATGHLSIVLQVNFSLRTVPGGCRCWAAESKRTCCKFILEPPLQATVYGHWVLTFCSISPHVDFVEMAIGQNRVPPLNIPIPTKIGSKMGVEFTYQPKSGSQNGFEPWPNELLGFGAFLVCLRASPREVKHHPALLMWVAGNESQAQRFRASRFFRRRNFF